MRRSPIGTRASKALATPADACTRVIQSGSLEGHSLAWAYNNRGYFRRRKGELDKAIADLDEAIRLDPNFAFAYINRGNTWFDRDEFDKAMSDYSTVIRLTPRSAVAYYNLGNAFRKRGELDKAIANYDEAIRLDPNYMLAYLNRGGTRYKKGELDKAIADDDQAIRLDPKSPAAYHNRGNAWREKGEFDNAIADYDAALRIDSSQERVFVNRGLAWFAKSDYAQVLADFAQAAKLKPENAYYAIWVEIASQRVSSTTRLPEAVAHLDMRAWPAQIARMFLGQTTEAAVLAAAENALPQEVTGRVCEADFYAGEYTLGQGGREKEEAIRLLHLAEAACPKDYQEWFATRIELKRLGQTP